MECKSGKIDDTFKLFILTTKSALCFACRYQNIQATKAMN